MPISSGPLGLTRAYQHAPSEGGGGGGAGTTWNASGAHSRLPTSSLRSLDRPAGAGVARDVSVLFGHAQLIPTYTLHPAEEERAPAEHAWLDPAHSPAPRDSPASKQAHARREQGERRTAFLQGEGDTIDRLGLGPRSQAWQGGVIRSAERHRPLSASVRGTQKAKPIPGSAAAAAAASRQQRGARSRSPSAGRHGLSVRPPLQLSSSVYSPLSSARGAGSKDRRSSLGAGVGANASAATARDVQDGRFRSPHGKDLALARQYVRKLDREIEENARLALEDERVALQNQAVTGSREGATGGGGGDSSRLNSPSRKQQEWNQDLMLGVHVRAVGMERKWHEQGEGMERISALYDPSLVNVSSTHILQQSLRGGVHASPDTSDLVNRSTVLHSPSSSSGARNLSAAATSRGSIDNAMPDKSVDLGFWASGTRKHEEADGGKTLLKSQAWPRDPVAAAVLDIRAGGSGGGSSSARGGGGGGGVNTSTSSARVRAQENGELNFDLAASFGPGPSRSARASSASASASPAGSRARSNNATAEQSFQLMNGNTGSWHASSPQHQKRLRPAGSAPLQAPGPLSPNPYSVSAMPRDFQSSSMLNTSTAASGTLPVNSSVTAASMHAQALHAQKFDESTGALRTHPRNFADHFLASQGIHVASGRGGLEDTGVASSSFTGAGLNATTAMSGLNGSHSASTGAVPHGAPAGRNIAGNGSILDLSGAIARRAKAPWKFGGGKSTRKHDRKIKNEEDFVLEEARKKRLPSTRPRSADARTHSHSHAHRSGHSLSRGQTQFVTGAPTLKPSLHLSSSGRNILGRTRVTKRVDLTEKDWAYIKRRERLAREEAYALAKRGPADPPPHHQSVIEEAMHLEKVARKEREMVAREREWRAQQIWLHEKKKGMDKLAERAKAATRTMPPRPARRRASLPARSGDESMSMTAGVDNAVDVGAGDSGAQRPWNGPLIVPSYLDSMQRVVRDIDSAAEVRGKDRLAPHARAQIAAQKGKLVLDRSEQDDARSSGISGEQTSLQEDWPSKHHLSQGDQLSNPLLDDSTTLGGAAAGSSRYRDYELDELELEEMQRRVAPSATQRARAEVEREEAEEMARLDRQAQQLREQQDWRERAAERAISGAKGAASVRAVSKSAAAPRASVFDSEGWAAQRDAEERAQAAQRTLDHARRQAAVADATAAAASGDAAAPTRFASTRHPAALSFTSPSASQNDSRGGSSSSGPGSSALAAAQIYDRRLREMIAFLRVRQPYWSDAMRHEKASAKARDIVTQELARMGPRGGAPAAPAASSSAATTATTGPPDWFAEYEATFLRHDTAAASQQHQRDLDEHKYSSSSRSDSRDFESVPIGARAHLAAPNPFSAAAAAARPSSSYAAGGGVPASDAEQLEAMRREAEEITQRYERMRQQATEAYRVR